jgi:hypothetical protein
MSRKMKLPTPSKRDCKPQPIECFGSPPTQAELKMISKKSGIPFIKLQELVRDIKRDNKSLGKGTKKEKTRNNTGGITERNKDRLVTSIMIVSTGGAAFYGLPALGSWFVTVGILPRLCAQNMLQHVFIEAFRDITQLPVQTCHDISQDYQGRVSAMIATLVGTGLINYKNIREFYSLTHDFIKAKIFGTAEQADAAQAALITAGGVKATAAQIALTEHREKQQEQQVSAESPTAEQKEEQENIDLHKKHGFYGRPTKASTKFFSDKGKKPALKRSTSYTGIGSKTSPLASSVPSPPASFKPPLSGSKARSKKAASKSSPKSEKKSSKGGITRRRSSRSKRSRRKHRRRK